METYSEKQKWKIVEEFNWLGDKRYLDHAGAALYSSIQLENVFAHLKSNLYGNHHSLSDASKNCNDVIDQVRQRIISFFHTSSNEYSVVFTSGATAAIKMVVENFAWNDVSQNGKTTEHLTSGKFVYTATNHTSLVGGRELAAEKGANVVCLSDAATEKIMDCNRPLPIQSSQPVNNSLFAYPAQCNFSGRKFPLSWVELVSSGILNHRQELGGGESRWYSLLDAATYCGTNSLDLSKTGPDFVCLSFYKIFGYPTGLGALLIKKGSEGCLKKKYFGGGTVDMVLPSQHVHKPRDCLHERFEDGTLSYLSIISLTHGFNTFTRLGISMKEISVHVFWLARLTVTLLKKMRHWNGQPLVEIYADSDYSDIKKQGGIVTFNLKRSDGSFIGFIEVLHVANSYKIQLRTGCFCNTGACQRHLQITDKQMMANFQAGHICGDERDLINGRPTGAIRVSFGYPSSYSDVQTLIKMLQETFLEKVPTQQISIVDLPPAMKQMTLESIRLYPIKSCGAMDVKSWALTARGLHLDRQWMVVNSSGVCLTQKQEPLLCRVMPIVDPTTQQLTITFAGEDPINVHLPIESQDLNQYNLCKNKVCGDMVDGVDCGDEVSDWLERNMGQLGLRLIKQRSQDERRSKIRAIRGHAVEEEGKLSLANQAQYLVINSRSIEWLKEKLRDEEDFNLDTLKDRFRANFILSGNEALEETEWETIQIGLIKFKVDGACTRCQMICIDQQTGEKNRKPLVELSRALDGKLRFGIYCSHVGINDHTSTKISIADSVLINRKSN